LRSKLAFEHSEYDQLGLTDAVLLTLSENKCTILTVDLDLYLAALRKRLTAINYNHVRDQMREDFKLNR